MEEAIKAKVLLVGGEETYADQFIIKAEKHGIYLQKEAHIGWDAQPKTSFPRDIDVAIVLKDICNHKLRDWTRKEARKNNIRFCEISQKISVGIAGLRHCLGLSPNADAPDFEDTKIQFSEPLAEWDVIRMTHEGICESPLFFLPRTSPYLASKKKFLNRVLRDFVKIVGEDEASWGEIKKTKNNPFSILFEDYKSILKRKLVGYELIQEMVLNVYNEMLSLKCSFFEIQRVLLFTFGYQLSKEQEKEIKLNRKPMEKTSMEKTPVTTKPVEKTPVTTKPVEKTPVTDFLPESVECVEEHPPNINSKKIVKKLYSLCMVSPTEYLSLGLSQEDKIKSWKLKYSPQVDSEIYASVLDKIKKTSRLHHQHADKKTLVKARETWGRQSLSLREAGTLSFTNSEFSKNHKDIWGSRVSDEMRLLLRPLVEPITEDLEEVTVYIGEYVLGLTGELKIKEIKSGTKLEIVGKKTITIESFDGEVLKGVTIK